jgi:uncharacterized protein (TIGR03067 family)
MMRTVILMMAAGALLAVTSLRADEKTDFKGTWIPSEGMAEGKKLPDNFLSSTKLMLQEGKYSVVVGEEKEDGTYKVDESKKPATVDITPTTGMNKGKTIPAIIEVRGDTMRVCYNTMGQDRPKDFNSTAENKFVMMVYKKQK